jgi:two-component system chemotaxis sensor kinase CheA
MDKTKLIQRLMATFLEELEEHVRTLNQDLLALEKDPQGAERAQRLKSLFRTAHSLKGAARSVNVAPVEKACHHLEEALSAVRDGTRDLDPDLFALLFRAADALEEAGMRLREQRDLSGSPLAELLPRLESPGPAPPRPAAPPRAGRAAPAPAPAPPQAASAEPDPRIARIEDEVAAMGAELAELRSGLAELRAGLDAVRAGLDSLRTELGA